MLRSFLGWKRPDVSSWNLCWSLTLHTDYRPSRPVYTRTSATAPHTIPDVVQVTASTRLKIPHILKRCVILFTVGNGVGACFFFLLFRRSMGSDMEVGLTGYEVL
jgi:hypothetical protein